MAIFDGIRLIDLSQGIAGALTSLLLAEQGADVIKVEPPGGDPTRQTEAGFFIWNRSKRSVTLDLGDGGCSAQRCDRLLESADVLLDSCSPSQSAASAWNRIRCEARFPASGPLPPDGLRIRPSVERTPRNRRPGGRPIGPVLSAARHSPRRTDLPVLPVSEPRRRLQRRAWDLRGAARPAA